LCRTPIRPADWPIGIQRESSDRRIGPEKSVEPDLTPSCDWDLRLGPNLGGTSSVS